MIRRNLIPLKKIETSMPVAIYDSETGEKFLTNNIGKYLKNRYIPFGIVVIPTSHDVYGTGECGVMGICPFPVTTYNFSYLEPAKSTNYITNNLLSADRLLTLGKYESGYFVEPELYNVGFSLEVEFPFLTNVSSGTKNIYDTKTCYYNNKNYVWLHSPYLTNDTRNPDYYKAISGYNNILSKYNGRDKTLLALNNIDKPTGWETAEIINDSKNSNSGTGTLIVSRYKTPGTNERDWFIPSLSEVGYLPTRWTDINKTYLQLKSLGFDTYSKIDVSNNQVLIIDNVYSSYNILLLMSTGRILDSTNSGIILPFTKIILTNK